MTYTLVANFSIVAGVVNPAAHNYFVGMLLRRLDMDRFLIGTMCGELDYYLRPFRANRALSAIRPAFSVNNPYKATNTDSVYLPA